MLMLNIVKNIDRERFEISVCCLGEKGIIGEQIQSYGIDVVSFNFKRIGSFNVSLLHKLWKLIKIRKFDIVHTHMYHANLYGRLAAWLARVPVIFASIHNIYRRKKLHRMFINYLLSKITNKIFVGTQTVFEDVRRFDRVPEEKIEILPYGIDANSFIIKYDMNTVREKLGFSGDDFIIGNVARLEEAKGQKYLIEAVHILRRRGLNLKCLIIGSGSLETVLKNLTITLGIEADILFLGTRQDLSELLSAMDIFVFPSLWEGLPLALLSAMAAALPVITTHAGGVKDIIVDGENGIVVPPSDSLAIADAIERISKDVRMQKTLSRNAFRDVIRCHSAAAMTKRLEKIYTSIFNHSRWAI